jgi:hypothetical protein
MIQVPSRLLCPELDVLEYGVSPRSAPPHPSHVNGHTFARSHVSDSPGACSMLINMS